MQTSNLNSINNNINRTDFKRLVDLLENYDIVPDEVLKQENLYLIKANSKFYHLKKIRENHKITMAGIKLREHLIKNGFNILHENIKTRDGKDLLKFGNSYYCLAAYGNCRTADYSNFDDVLNIVLQMARFHIKSQGFYNKYIKVEYKTLNWLTKEEKYKRVFGIIKEIIKSKRVKTMFDVLFMESMEFIKEQLQLSVKLINNTNYDKILRNSELKGTLCIDDFKFKNILVSIEQEYYFINFDKVNYNMTVYDLCKYLKKVMNRREYAWDFKYAREIIDAYCTVNPLSRDELAILLALMIFPRNFYKLGRRRYIKRKKWDENKYLSKLMKVTGHIENQRHFIDEYLACYIPQGIDNM